METEKRANSIWATVLVVIAFGLLAFVIADLWTKWIIKGPRTLWPFTAGALILFLAGIGYGINGRWEGVLIDSRNKISLSRLQIVLWTVVVLSAFFTIALPRAVLPDGMDAQVDVKYYTQMSQQDEEQETNQSSVCFPSGKEESNPAGSGQTAGKVTVAEECRDPLAINLPGELLAALGISTVSLTGSVIVKNNKQKKAADLRELENKVKTARAEFDKKQIAAAILMNEVNDLREKKAQLEEELKKKRGGAKTEVEDKLKNLDLMLTQVSTEATSATLAQTEAKQEWEAVKQTLDDIREDKQKSVGLLRMNKSPSDARWSDLFRFGEISNYELIDITKVQMFLITLVIIISYSSAIYNKLFVIPSLLKNPLGLDFPTFSVGLISLLGISHAGYLSIQSATQTKTQGV